MRLSDSVKDVSIADNHTLDDALPTGGQQSRPMPIVNGINKNDSNPGFVRSRDRKNNSRVAPDIADSMSSRPYSPLFSPILSRSSYFCYAPLIILHYSPYSPPLSTILLILL